MILVVVVYVNGKQTLDVEQRMMSGVTLVSKDEKVKESKTKRI